MKLRSNKYIRIATFLIAVIMCILTIPANALDSVRMEKQYYADIAYGKIFIDGVNQPIRTSSQLDTQIENVGIYNRDDMYILKFGYENTEFEIECKSVEAKANNENSDHYLFSPIGFSSDMFNCVSISFTTSANIHDLMSVNSNFVGTPVLSIIFENKDNSDVYYWQAQLLSTSRTLINMRVSTLTSDIEAANEFYYIKDTERIDSIDISNYDGLDIASEERCDELKEELEANENSRVLDYDNPYLSLGIPNSIFTTATETWRWLTPDRDENGQYLPIYYYAYSYTKYGNPNIMTHIMILEWLFRTPASHSYTIENGVTYASFEGMFRIEMFRDPDTVVYYTDTGLFDYMEGGKFLTQIDTPSVELKKTSTNIPHVVTGRYEFSNADNASIWPLANLVLKDVMVGILDATGYGYLGALVNIVDLIANPSDAIGASEASEPFEVYSSSFYVQQQRYGHAMGSIKSAVNGYLNIEGHFLGSRVWFATPETYGASVKQITGVAYVSPSYT